MTTDPIADYLDDLDVTYARLHTEKEDAFWTVKMGLGADPERSQRALDERDIAVQRFLRDQERLRRVRELSTRTATEDQQVRAKGWLRTFESYAMPSAEAAALAEEITADEGRLASARGAMSLGYEDPSEGFVRASSVELSNMLLVEPDEARRRAAFDGLRSIERYVLDRGFLEIVKKRNRVGRMAGAEDYYDYKTKQAEGMSKAEVFSLLDDLEARTREAGLRAIEHARTRFGSDRVTPWNVYFLVSGDVTRETDPYFPFRAAIGCWGRAFSALGIRYAGAELVLDLLDRKGKYENGFMHGPVVAWRRAGQRIPARIHFTANALPGVVGAGKRALMTLLHEGGHAAHFANIDMPSPCFGQEFAPTSTAFAETQSMFCDSLLEDGDFQRRYALDVSGQAAPLPLIERAIDANQPFSAWMTRAMLSVCYAEKAIYELPESELTVEGVLRTLREVERKFSFLQEGSVRPSLAVPHLISGEGSAYYHGYVLARMAVHQARAHFRDRDGHLVDNPRIGPELTRLWWQPGNSLRFDEFVRRLTGSPLSAAHYSEHVNATAEQHKADTREAIARLDSIAPGPLSVELDAKVHVVHGNETIADLRGDFEAFSRQFAEWIDGRIATANSLGRNP